VSLLQKRLAVADEKTTTLSAELSTSRAELAATSTRLEQVEQGLSTQQHIKQHYY
jgi:hypothetical protein